MSKPEIIFSFPACMGGVASFNYNIINHSRLIKEFHSKVILLNADEDKRPIFNEEFLADEVISFNYSFKENKYHLLSRLNKLLGSTNGAVVTDNSLTIEAAGLFKNPKTVFNLLHDYFYVNETVQLGDLVDAAIAHSSFFSDAVFASNPVLFSGRSFYIPYGVKTQNEFPLKNNPVLKLVFLGRLVKEKGVHQLFAIDELLRQKNIPVEWSIIGKGPLKSFLEDQWKANTNVSFFEPDSTSEVYDLLKSQDIFVFPTFFEGTPVSILECLANGVIPVVNDLPGGIRDIVRKNIGFRCELNNLREFTEKIALMASDRNRLEEMQGNCYELSIQSFDIQKNADGYFLKFLEYTKYKRPMKNTQIRFSRLDNAYMPKALVKWIRAIK